MNLPEGAAVLRIECQAGAPKLWALVDTDAPFAYRTFMVFGTGREIGSRITDPEWKGLIPPEASLIHASTFQHGAFVWHAFERVAEPAA